jgi:hypothetical protein
MRGAAAQGMAADGVVGIEVLVNTRCADFEIKV